MIFLGCIVMSAWLPLSQGLRLSSPMSKVTRVGYNAPIRRDRAGNINLAKNLAQLMFGMDCCEYVDLGLNTTNSSLNSMDMFIGVGWFLDDRFRQARLTSKMLNLNSENFDVLPDRTQITGAFEAHGRPVAITYENEQFFNPVETKYDIMLCTSREQVKSIKPSANVLFPFAMHSMLMRNDYAWPDLYKSPQELGVLDVSDKTGFCAYVTRHCQINQYRSDAAVRVAFIDLLAEKYKRCNSFKDHCRSTHSDPSFWSTSDVSEWYGGTYYDHATRALTPYKFSLAMENAQVDGFITEKIVNAMLAGTIPVYFGAMDIEHWINPARFINCNFEVPDLRERGMLGQMSPDNFEELVNRTKAKYRTELENCIRKIEYFDHNITAYREVVQAPILLENSLLNFTSAGAVLKRLYAQLKG